MKFIFNRYFIFFVALIILSARLPALNAQTRVHLELTASEKAFIAEHPVIRVSSEMDWPPFDFTIGNQPFGMSIDVVNLAAGRLGLTIEYINGYRWNELVEMFKKKELDVLQSAYQTEDRKKYGLYTRPYYKDKTVFVILETAPDVSDIKDLSGKIIAMPKGWGYEKYLIDNYPEVNLLTVNNMAQAFRAVRNKKADAVIELSAVAHYLIEKNFMDGLKTSGWFRQYDNNEAKALHLLIRNDKPVLHQMFEKALKSITPGDILSIEKKWLGQVDIIPAFKLALTHNEQMFLEAHPVLRVANETDWPPFDFVRNNEPSGFAIDYLKFLGEITGVKFEFINGVTWPELLQKGRQKQVDIFPGLWKSPDRESFLTFTQSYIELIKVLAVREDLPLVQSMADMKGLKIALPRGYVLSEKLMEQYPDHDFTLVDNPSQGLKQISVGKVDGFIGSQGIINYIIKKQFIDNIRIAFEIDIDDPLPLHMAVRKDWPVMADILNKAMDTVTPEQFNSMVKKWISTSESPGILNSLTAAEKKYIGTKKKISLCVQRDLVPFESIDTRNTYNGIISNFYSLMGKKLGIPFEVTSAGTAKDCLDCLMNRDCDMVTVADSYFLNKPKIRLTIPYAEYPLVIATDRKAIYIDSIGDLPGKRIGISKKTPFVQQVKDLYPDVEFVPVEDTQKGLLAVQRGELFGLVDTAPKIGFYIQSNEMVDLKISGELPYNVIFQAAVHRDDPLLDQIFEKGSMP